MPPAKAHVQPECGELFITAGEQTEIMIRAQQRITDVVMEDKFPAYVGKSYEDWYWHVIDLNGQLLGAMTAQFEAMTAAIRCLNPGAFDADGK